MKKKISHFLDKNMEFIIILFLFLQPFLDVFAGINQHFLNWNVEFNLIFRILFLLFSILYLLFFNRTKYRKISLIYLAGLFLYSIFYALTVLYVKDLSVLFYEIKNLVLCFYFPILLLFFWNVYHQYKISIQLKYLVMIFACYIFFISIPNILHLSIDSYTQGKTGNSGWFNSANSVSSIISILLPFFIIYWKEEKKLILVILSLFFFYAIFSMGTKVPILSIGIIVIINLIYFIYNWIKRKEYKKIVLSAITTILITLVIAFIIPKTSFYRNIKIHAEFLGIESISEIFTNPYYIDRFIFSDRLTFFDHTKEVYQNAEIIEKLVGIGYIENYSTDYISTKMVEIDYFDIFFRHGIIGFILYFMPVIILTYNSLKYFKFSFNNINILISIMLIYLLALFSGHIFNVPSTSIFVAFILSFSNFKNNQMIV